MCTSKIVSFVPAYRLSTEIQAQVSRAESNTPEPKDEKWSDLVDDLWENHLPYFRKRGYVVSSRPTSVDSFSEEADPSTTILNELTRHDSDQNLLELLKKDAPVRHQAPPSPLPDIGMCVGGAWVVCDVTMLILPSQEQTRRSETWPCSRN